LYEECGSGLAKKVTGQFAFALGNLQTREWILARDHTGIAPLFYTIVRGLLIFGSEIKAILQHPSVTRRVDLTGLDQIITFPGLVSPRTMFEGIRALRPGHLLHIRDGRFEEREYWDLNYPVMSDTPGEGIPEQFYVDRLEQMLSNAVTDRLAADVPVGFYLSGGLDSSLLGCLIHSAANRKEQRHSFSITFPDAEFDERPFQRLMADRLGSIHHDTEFHAAQIAGALQKAVWFAEAPLKESYNTCSLALSELVSRTGLKVVVTGEGADELFAGYVGYRLDQSRHQGENRPAGGEFFLEQELRETLWGDQDFFYERDYYQHRDVKSALYSDQLCSRLGEFDSTLQPLVDVEKIKGRHPVHKRSYLDFKLRLSDHLVADHGDRVGYANSVEARYPFLDLNLIEFSRTIPPGLLVKEGTEKHILRMVAAKHLPPTILNREKFAFVAPGTPSLLRQNIEWINDTLSPATIRRQGYFNHETIERLKARNRADGARVNTTFDSDYLMIVLTFGVFLEQFGLPAL
jgi:asparagine synthase (glutamine-hydrolysing)